MLAGEDGPYRPACGATPGAAGRQVWGSPFPFPEHGQNLMIYVCRSRCKCYSPRTWSNFVMFDFSINLYAMDRRECLVERDQVHVKENE